MTEQLSPTMQSAVEFAKTQGNKLTRHPGGLWTGKKHPSLVVKDVYDLDDEYLQFGTKTIQALVARGIAEYSDWKEGRNGRFPIEVTLIDNTRTERGG